jgi:chromosome segregation and condensation protein ScpB
VSKKPLKAIIEAILFASDEPVALERLADAAGEGVTVRGVRDAVRQLVEEYDATGRSPSRRSPAACNCSRGRSTTRT